MYFTVFETCGGPITKKTNPWKSPQRPSEPIWASTFDEAQETFDENETKRGPREGPGMHLPAMYFTILESWAPFYAVLVIGHAPPHLVYYGAQEMWRPCRTQSPVPYRAHASQPCILQHLGPRASFVVICPCYRVRASGPCILRYLRAREDQFDSVGTCYRVSALPPCIFTVLGSYGGFILLGIFYRVRAFPPCILRYLGAGEALFYSLPVIVYAPSRLVFYRPSRLALYGT